MKILIIASLFRPYARGGAEIVAQTIADELKQTHEVIILTTGIWHGFRSLAPRGREEDGLTVYRFYPLNIFSFPSIEEGKSFFIRLIWHACALFNAHSYAAARFVIAKEKPDRIYTHNLTGLGFLVPAAVRHARVPWIHTVHDVQLGIPSGVLIEKKAGVMVADPLFSISRIYSVLMRTAMVSPSSVVYPSQFLRTFYDRKKFFPASNKYVIQNPIPSAMKFTYEEFEEALHARLQALGRNEMFFSYVGLLKAHKGLPDLLAAFFRLNNPNARLVIAGTGTLFDTVARLAQQDSRIMMKGHVSREGVRQLLSQTHCTVVPSLLCENAPMVIQESFAAGVPVIAARSGGAAERVREGENGFSYPPGDVTLLAHALDRLAKLTNKEYETMSTRAYQTVRDDTANLYCKKLLTLF
ncbi:glycosyltransferase [Candidatus Uhrbacteria bacterium]|nr:glycosyltransferase [Candidatus Uhrbacteria bacterium]